jgi:4-hydroxy-tetrahydrodipicolinate synthase
MSKLREPIFKGCATALATPFRDGEIDYFALGEMIDRQILGGVAAIVICGTTGEASTLSVYEHLKCIEFAVRYVDGRLPVIAGSGGNCTKKSVHLSKKAAEIGADALLVVTPYYNKASENGLVAHYTEIADASVKPIILYNVPSRTGVNIPLSVYSRLSDHQNIVAVKEASGNLSAIAALASECGDRLDIYSGNDDQVLPILSLGGLGVISVVSNILPRETQNICDYYFSNDTISAKNSQLKLIDLISALFCEVNPIPLKYALSLMGICQKDVRLPLCEPTETSKQKIESVLKKYALI